MGRRAEPVKQSTDDVSRDTSERQGVHLSLDERHGRARIQNQTAGSDPVDGRTQRDPPTFAVPKDADPARINTRSGSQRRHRSHDVTGQLRHTGGGPHPA
jgi:hypothetical protein